MNRCLLLMLAILLLAGVAPLAAQSSQPPGHLTTPGATAVTGKVVSINSGALTILTDSGETRTFLIDNGTVGVKEYPVNSRVSVDFTLDDQARGIAKVIMGVAGSRMEPVQTSTSTPVTEVERETETTRPTESTQPSFPYTAPEQADETDLVPEQQSSDVLPETASKLPLIGLLGLLALSASLVLSRFS